jgi:4'-phosphopantetheinyl transferase
MHTPGRPAPKSSEVHLWPESLEVHLWIIRLEANTENFAQSLSCLSPDEIARFERFYFDRHRRAFALGRAALRILLGRYLGIEPADVGFVYGDQGKPALADASCPLRFNVSNSGDFAAYAFTTACEIGVDIEQHRAVHDFENIAQRFFSPEETSDLMSLPAADRTSAFFHCWSRKEAFIKVMGGGLSIPLHSFRVSLRPGDEPRMISLDGSAEAARAWTLHTFDAAPEYAGAIAYRGKSRSLQMCGTLSMDELLGNNPCNVPPNSVND